MRARLAAIQARKTRADDSRFIAGHTLHGDSAVIPKGKVKMNSHHSAFLRDQQYQPGGFCGLSLTRFSKGWIKINP